MGLYEAKKRSIDSRRLAAYDRFHDAVARAESRLARKLEVLSAESEGLEGKRGDREVLVRKTPGPEVTSYHTVVREDLCGRVLGRGRSIENFARWFETDAKRQGLARCSACRWRRVSAAA